MPVNPPGRRENTGRSSEYSDQARYAWGVPGNLTTTDNDKIPILPGQDDIVSTATAQLKTAPATQSVKVDVLLVNRVDGSTVSTLCTLEIPAGDLEPSGDATFTSVRVDSTKGITLSITQIGTGTVGATLSVVVQ
jgi:hypothetical protein